MVFVSLANKEFQEEKRQLLNPSGLEANEPILIGEELYPPALREDPAAVIEAMEKSAPLGLKYKPIALRQELLLNGLIDCFLPRDDPAKLIDFVEKLKVIKPELAVRLLERCLPPIEKVEKTNGNTTNVQINQGPAPVVLIRSNTPAPEFATETH